MVAQHGLDETDEDKCKIFALYHAFGQVDKIADATIREVCEALATAEYETGEKSGLLYEEAWGWRPANGATEEEVRDELESWIDTSIDWDEWIASHLEQSDADKHNVERRGHTRDK